ncbi:MAG TPA: inositol 2-dehydrogenase [Candidatus Ornithoclostridium excrementipullorum]|nr:inositol 2-dehydrogenase [Candidatus Ornithoclostridium excrementipullorum]
MVRIGIIGAGRIGKVHCESIGRYVKNAVVACVADPFMDEGTEQTLRALGAEKVTKDYREILADKSVDAVLICSSTDTHAQISVEAIKAGKHVFCEKPVDHDVKKILTVKEALQGGGVKYQVGFNRRFDHNFEAVKKAIDAGRIGHLDVLKICSRDPAAPSADYIKVSGGIFLDMTIHDFDMVRYLSSDEVESVYAVGGVTVDKAIGEAGDIDTAVVTMKLKGGALAVIDNCRRAAYGYDQRAEAFGSLGQIAVANDASSTAVISDANGVTAEKPLYFFLERYMQAYVKEVSEFVRCIEEDRPVPVGIEDGLQAVVIGLAAKRSLQTGAPVRLDDIVR